EIDAGRIVLRKSAYSKKELDARIDVIMKSSKPSDGSGLSIYTAAPAPDGSGIQITAKAGTTDRVHELAGRSSAGIPVTVTPGNPMTTTEWRWNDATPFIGGDVL